MRHYKPILHWYWKFKDYKYGIFVYRLNKLSFHFQYWAVMKTIEFSLFKINFVIELPLKEGN